MTHATLIPFLATSGPYWFADTYQGLNQSTISKMVLHSTETPPPNCPGYSGGGAAPTLTIDPWNQRGWQHFPANMSARALVDSAGTVVRENRDNVAQIEILGYADYRINSRYALANIPDAGLAFIARVLRWYADEGWGLPLRTTLEWPQFGTVRLNQVRLSGPAYDAYTGVLGHMHVSGNTHVDPAGLNINRLIALAQGATGEDDVVTEAEMDRIAEKVLTRRFPWIDPATGKVGTGTKTSTTLQEIGSWYDRNREEQTKKIIEADSPPA